MTDVNKNIFEAYKSMYEEKMSPEECIRDTLKKEGGASGLAPLDKALKDKGHDMSAKEVISKMSDVKQHKDGDYIFCLLYTSPSPRDDPLSRMPSSA